MQDDINTLNLEEQHHVYTLVKKVKAHAASSGFNLNQEDWDSILQVLKSEKEIRSITMVLLQEKVDSPRLKIMLV